jgi:hypothetical protein
MFNSDGYVNTSGFPMLTGTPTGAGATALANSVVQMLQFSPVLSGNSEFVFDQIKISTGEYENTVAAGNTSTEDGVTELSLVNMVREVQITNSLKFTMELIAILIFQITLIQVFLMNQLPLVNMNFGILLMKVR